MSSMFRRVLLLLPAVSCLTGLLWFAGCSDGRHTGADASAVVAPQMGPPSSSISSGGEDPRKIVYQARVEYVVPDLTEAEQSIARLVKHYGGYLAEASVSQSPGVRRTGRWTVRVPVDQYEMFLESLSDLGVAEDRSQSAEDVTEQFIDLEARIASKKQLEERLLELLKEPHEELKAVIEVERELARVRSEVEQMEGKLRYLNNRVSLTTVDIHAREQRGFQSSAVPTLPSRVADAWRESLQKLRSFSGTMLIVAVAVFPWLVTAVLIGLPLRWLIRRWRAPNKGKTPDPVPDGVVEEVREEQD